MGSGRKGKSKKKRGDPPLDGGRTLLDDWARVWFDSRRHRVAPKTLANERSHARNYLGSLRALPLAEITPGTIEDWLAAVERAGVQARPPLGRPHTVRICHGLLSAMLRDAVKHQLLATPPMSLVKRPRMPPPQPKYLELDDLRRVVEATVATGDPRSLSVLLMAGLGLRRNEALGLTWGDVDLDRRLLRLRFQLGRDPDGALGRRPLKTRTSARELRLAGDVAKALDTARAGRAMAANPDDFVVSFGDGRPVDPDAMSRWLSSVGRSVGITVSPHRLRHSAATAMLNAGVAIETVGKVLGHGDVRTTAIYARVLDTSSDAALDDLARLLEGK